VYFELYERNSIQPDGRLQTCIRQGINIQRSRLCLVVEYLAYVCNCLSLLVSLSSPVPD